MKVLLCGFVMVAGLVIAAGGAMLGQRDDPSAQQSEGCCPSIQKVVAQSAGSCCATSGKQKEFVSAEAEGEKGESCCRACCGTEKQVVATQSPTSCCSSACSVAAKDCGAKADVVLTSTEGAKDGECCKECKSECVEECAKECAEECAKECAEECVAACGTKQGDCESKCPVAVAMQRLPKMTYTVGSQKTCCSEKAKQLAQQHNAPVRYVVAENEYECCQSAKAALVEQTERFVNDFVSVRRCPASGTTFACGKSTACSAEAQQWTSTIGKAVEKVKMCYVVDGEQTSCSASAEALAQQKNSKVEYVVADQKMNCPLSARLELARAKYKSVVQAMAAASTSS